MSVLLNWVPRHNGVTQEIYRSETTFNVDTLPAALTSLADTDNMYVDTTTADGVAYYYAVGAVLGARVALSSVIRVLGDTDVATIPPPVPPPAGVLTSYKIDPFGDNSLRNGWNFQLSNGGNYVANSVLRPTGTVSYTGTGKFGNCFEKLTNNTTDFLKSTTTVHAGASSPMSISVWANAAFSTLGNQAILSANESTTLASMLLVNIPGDSRKICMFLYGTTNSDQIRINSGVTLADSAWVHIVFTWDGTNTPSSSSMKMYVNGVLAPSPTFTTIGTFTGLANYAASTLKIGSWLHGDASAIPYKGKVDQVMTFNKVLSQTEVTELAGMTLGTQPLAVDSTVSINSGSGFTNHTQGAVNIDNDTLLLSTATALRKIDVATGTVLGSLTGLPTHHGGVAYANGYAYLPYTDSFDPALNSEILKIDVNTMSIVARSGLFAAAYPLGCLGAGDNKLYVGYGGFALDAVGKIQEVSLTTLLPVGSSFDLDSDYTDSFGYGIQSLQRLGDNWFIGNHTVVQGFSYPSDIAGGSVSVYDASWNQITRIMNPTGEYTGGYGIGLFSHDSKLCFVSETSPYDTTALLNFTQWG